jgi:indolepyruvate ferredoxin oxidoreductase
MPIDPRFGAANGLEVFIGNELLVKGCLETEGGVHLMTGYPGSPVAGFFDTLSDIAPLLKEKGVRAFQANNEALAVAAVNGSQMIACRSVAVFKSVGLHVASDALALGNLAGAHPQGGAVIVIGDDPWCDSTQVPADSRFLCEHLRMPVVEPGTPQEMKDWLAQSFKLSQAGGLYIGFVVTTTQADGGGTVECRPNCFPQLSMHQRIALETAKISLEKVLLPPRTWQQELRIPERFAATMAAARELGINQIIPASAAKTATGETAPIGFITTGMGRSYLEHVLAETGLSRVFPILNMGMSYPADIELVARFAGMCRTVVVIEERRSFLEKNIRDGLFHALGHEQAADISGRLYGKAFPKGQDGKSLAGIPEGRGLNPSLLATLLIPLIQSQQSIPAHLRNGRLTAELEQIRRASRQELRVIASQVVPRTPTFCPGCPHRDSSAVLLDLRKSFADRDYMLRHHGMAPVDLVAHGDTGCYTMLMFAPTEQLMHNYSGMGLGGGTGSGIDPFITNKQIVFMGDGTFFHSGQIAISNSIKAGQDITYIILENKTTAMTGHQEHAGTELDVLGNRSYIQDIDAIVRAMAGTSPLTVVKLSPADRAMYRSVLEKTILSDGVKVVIADKECGITAQRTKAREERKIVKTKGYLPRKTHMNITPDVCENCLECTKQTACPGLTPIKTDYGQKIDTDLTLCVNDGACERVRVSNGVGTDVKPCPSFEQVTIIRKRRRRYTLPHLALDKLPEPTPIHRMSEVGDAWRVHIAGVGGMGVGIVGAILVRAGHREGYRVIFSDRKGLAIRNGGVYSQITFVADRPAEAVSNKVAGDSAAAYACTGVIPYGRAELLLGVDVLEAARAIDPRQNFRVADPSRTCAVLNLHKQATVNTLLGKEDFDPSQLRDRIFEHCLPSQSFAQNLSDLCERRLGSKQFVNIMMLGVAYQMGLIPVGGWSIAWAIKDTIKREQRRNLKAFNIGRKLVMEPQALAERGAPQTWEELLLQKARILRRTPIVGRRRADRYERLVQLGTKQMRELGSELRFDLALRIYDLMQWQDHRLARHYIDLVRGVMRRDSRKRGYAATRAVIWNLAKVMLIKDEPYVAYLLTRYEKKQRDIVKYGLDVSNGDRIVYRHHTSPEFNIGKRRIRLQITTRDWHLQLVKHMKWWRKLPGWHVREAAFRDWYIGLLSRVSLANDANYEQALRVLSCPEQVSGYREVRYPKQDAVREAIEAELAHQPTVEVSMGPGAVLRQTQKVGV